MLNQQQNEHLRLSYTKRVGIGLKLMYNYHLLLFLFQFIQLGKFKLENNKPLKRQTGTEVNRFDTVIIYVSYPYKQQTLLYLQGKYDINKLPKHFNSLQLYSVRFPRLLNQLFPRFPCRMIGFQSSVYVYIKRP